jgi:hypothetical protein
VPADTVTKYTLSRLILAAAGREDVTVVPTATGTAVNRILATSYPDANERLWGEAGYDGIPTIGQLVEGLYATSIQRST